MPIWASNQERDLQAVFLGRFAQFIQWPDKNNENFIITLIDENPFDNLLDDLYKDKSIHGKPIQIRYVTQIADIKESDIIHEDGPVEKANRTRPGSTDPGHCHQLGRGRRLDPSRP